VEEEVEEEEEIVSTVTIIFINFHYPAVVISNTLSL
jgi:hypothetical protein